MLIRFPNNREAAENTRLMQELDALLQSDDENLDISQVESRLEQLQKSTPVMTDYDPEKAWEEIQTRHPLLLETEQIERHHRSKTLLRVAAVAAAATFALVITVGALGGEPFQWVLEWGQNLLEPNAVISDFVQPPADPNSDYLEVARLMEADGHTAHACMTWLPAGCELQRSNRTLSGTLVNYRAEYDGTRTDGSSLSVTFHVRQLTGEQFSLSLREDKNGYTYEQDPYSFFIYRESEGYGALWLWEDFLYQVSGSLTEQELLQVLISIK